MKALSAYVKTTERTQINLMIYLKAMKEDKQTKSQISRWEGIIKTGQTYKCSCLGFHL